MHSSTLLGVRVFMASRQGFHGRMLSTMATDFTKNLKIKVIAIDLGVVIDGVNGLHSSRGEPPELHQKTSIKTDVPVKTTNPKEPHLNHDAPIDPKAKYGDKIKMKLAKSLANKVNQFGPTGLQAAMMGTASRWLIAEGMGELLDYAHNRTIRLAAVGRAVDYRPHTIEQLSTQLKNTKFSYIRSPIDTTPFASDKIPKEVVDRHSLASFLEMEERLHVSRSDVLVVSPDETTLSIARDRGYYTCRFRGEGHLYGQVSTDFVARNAVEIKDAIDDLVGIALRGSVSFSTY